MSTTDVQTAIGRFVWHDHISSDVEKAKTFYAELFGWTIETWKPGEMDYPMINADGKQHGGFGTAPEGVPSHWLGHVLVEDADETAAKAEAAGGKIIAPAMDIPEVGRIIVLVDPQGAVFSAFSPATSDPGPLAEGTFVWDELLTSDVEGAKSFYGEIFGWTTTEMDIGESDEKYTLFQRTGDVSVAGCMAKPADLPVPAAWITYIGTDDVDATAEKAASLGAHVQVPPMDIPNNIGRFSVVIDPAGAAIGLFKGNPT
jgi:predicted enzyme related to lactoylglutathione lyase